MSSSSSDSANTAAREVVVLGSTGSVGTQAMDVIRRNPGRFRVAGLAAGGGRVDLLAAQALEFGPEVVAVAKASAAQDLQLAFYAEAKRRGYAAGDFAIPKIVAGPDAVAEVAAWQCDVVLNGVTGALGLASTLAALDAGRTLALANKESLIMGGPLVKERARPGQIVPVDSEHSALAQCLRGGTAGEVRRLVLTASGGPFRGRGRAELGDVTPEQALNHPTWNMGPVVTINSATLINKGLEVIEAHLLFDVPMDRIEVMVHPQSVIHSMVEFTDGATLAQASPPDMRLPIALGIDWPDRVPDAAPGIDWTQAHTWELFPLDDEAFPAVALARRAGELGGTVPAVYNAANEECVDAFRAGRLPFLGIVDTVARVVEEHGSGTPGELALDDVLAADGWARARSRELTGTG
ncbi:1-deoxy-D-xylulose-5-phosphate reductoisomerase [Actinomadura bangladeshensis]|uniref:1-deoxy-D-xylulose 5-phosphate reductoisomerase n=1 Tax=Actinomadura bangladeshensis TaxID=453573 RepID=A0A6L9QM45_9ACTN|nr:1-deoxy-D-xylulose-5-phosphate reductoisomerase [Actinomadura bangladeshensis]NEA25763.1 1-deoxy-D-xylulose-5-phosphate reductoisomerase [Actinomadura bangladeshensis]